MCESGHVTKSTPAPSDLPWGSKQNSIKTFIGCVIGLVSGPQALPAISVCMFGNPPRRKKPKYPNETYNQLDYRLLLLLFLCVFLTLLVSLNSFGATLPQSSARPITAFLPNERRDQPASEKKESLAKQFAPSRRHFCSVTHLHPSGATPQLFLDRFLWNFALSPLSLSFPAAMETTF